MSSTPTTITAATFAPEAQFVLDHSSLPMPRGLDFIVDGGLSVFVDTAEQVQQWADVIGADMRSTQWEGNTHYTAHTFDPFYVTVTAIVPGVTS